MSERGAERPVLEYAPPPATKVRLTLPVRIVIFAFLGGVGAAMGTAAASRARRCFRRSRG